MCSQPKLPSRGQLITTTHTLGGPGQKQQQQYILILILILMLQFRCRRSGHPGQRPTANIRASLCPCSCRTFETVVASTSLSHTKSQDIVHFKVLNPCVVRSICVSQFRARQGTCSVSSLQLEKATRVATCTPNAYCTGTTQPDMQLSLGRYFRQ